MKNKYTLKKVVIIEFIVFLLLIMFFWIEEIFDLPYIIFNEEPTPINYVESLMETVVITIVFGILLYQTIKINLSMEKLESYIYVCARCHKIFINGEWISLDKYFNEYANKKTSHGLCDVCKRTCIQED